MQPESGIRTWQWIATIIVIIVLVIVGVMVFGGKSADTTVADDLTDTDQPIKTVSGTNQVVVSDQYPGNVVYVSSVQLTAPGWVVIHKDSAGKPGAIIGQVYVPAGINPAKVNLTEAIADGGTYYAMIHSDNGDKKFDASVDLPVKDSRGNTIMRIFRGSAAVDTTIKG